jgi:hypothetical protein
MIPLAIGGRRQAAYCLAAMPVKGSPGFTVTCGCYWLWPGPRHRPTLSRAMYPAWMERDSIDTAWAAAQRWPIARTDGPTFRCS